MLALEPLSGEREDMPRYESTSLTAYIKVAFNNTDHTPEEQPRATLMISESTEDKLKSLVQTDLTQ